MGVRVALGAGLAALALGGAPPTVAAQDPIEGTWSFTGGEVLVRATGTGTFTGTVTRETRFSECVHPVGERMWEIRPTAPPVYEGTHNWFRVPGCEPSGPGRAKWTILTTAPGNFTLRFCSVPPGDVTSPPENDPTGCDDLVRLRPPEPPPTFAQTVVLPRQGSRRCLSRRSFRIRLRQHASDPLVSAIVRVNGRRVRTVRGSRITAPVNLVGLPRGRYTVSITATTVTGRVIRGSRRYRTCTPRRRGGRVRI